jgi:hypothetical protein
MAKPAFLLGRIVDGTAAVGGRTSVGPGVGDRDAVADEKGVTEGTLAGVKEGEPSCVAVGGRGVAEGGRVAVFVGGKGVGEGGASVDVGVIVSVGMRVGVSVSVGMGVAVGRGVSVDVAVGGASMIKQASSQKESLCLTGCLGFPLVYTVTYCSRATAETESCTQASILWPFSSVVRVS